MLGGSSRGTLGLVRAFVDRASIALTVVIAVGLEILTIVSRYYWPVFAMVMVFLLGGTFMMLRHDLRERGPHVLILPLSYIGGVFLFHLFVSQGIFQQIFIGLASVGFFFLVARGIEWAYPTWNWFFTSVTFFLFAAGMDGLSFHLQFPVWATVLGVGVMTFLLTIHVLGRAPLPIARRIFWGTLLALLMSEVLIGFSFLPLSYLVVSGSLFVVFYIALHLLQRYVYHHLTRVVVREYLLLGSLALALMLGTARWAVL